MNILARHHLVEFGSCEPGRINSSPLVGRLLRRLCKRAPLSPVKGIQHKFSPHGLTVVFILKESHIAFSSWPEYGYACVNLLLCGDDLDLRGVFRELGDALGARKFRYRKWSCFEPTRRR